jgi:metallo-beta-lactamase family protein
VEKPESEALRRRIVCAALYSGRCGTDTAAVCDTFADCITRKLGFSAVAPYSTDAYDLATGECVEKGKIVRVDKKSKGRNQANAVYDRLLAAGQRLVAVIKKNKGLANKELAKFADQVTALCNKYDK